MSQQCNVENLHTLANCCVELYTLFEKQYLRITFAVSFQGVVLCSGD